MRLARGRARRFDDIGIDGALGEVTDPVQLGRLLFEDIDKQIADDLAAVVSEVAA